MSPERPSLVYLDSDRLAPRAFGNAIRNKSYRYSHHYSDLAAMQNAFEPGALMQYRQTQMKLATRAEMWPKLGFVFGGKNLFEPSPEGGVVLTDAIAFLHRTVTQQTNLIVHTAQVDKAQEVYAEWDMPTSKDHNFPTKAEVAEDLSIEFMGIGDDGVSEAFEKLAA